MVTTRNQNSFFINNVNINDSIKTVSIHKYLNNFYKIHGENNVRHQEREIENKIYSRKSDLYLLGLKENPQLWKSIYDCQKIKAPKCPRKKPRIGKMYQVEIDKLVIPDCICNTK
jgi:hypothetical protein